jgi:hypothetical protein
MLVQSAIVFVNAQKDHARKCLESYLNNGDKTFKWELKDSFKRDDLTFIMYLLLRRNGANLPGRTS